MSKKFQVELTAEEMAKLVHVLESNRCAWREFLAEVASTDTYGKEMGEHHARIAAELLGKLYGIQSAGV